MYLDRTKLKYELRELSETILDPNESLGFYETLSFFQTGVDYESGRIDLSDKVFVIEQLRRFFLLKSLLQK